MGFFNKYPYTDIHELNLDYVLEELKRLEKNVDEIIEKQNTYTDEQVKTLKEEIYNELNLLQIQIDAIKEGYGVLDLKIDTEVERLEKRLEDVRLSITSMYDKSKVYTDTAINKNNNYIIEEVSRGYTYIRVINYFTGESVSVQDMFDYLARLHTQDAITYTGLANKQLTYTQLDDKQITYSELATIGSSIL